MRNTNWFHFTGLIGLGLTLSIGLLGCETKSVPGKPLVATGNAGGHSHGDHKEATTMAEAIKEIDSHRIAIKDAFAKKQPEDAHDSLHEIGHVIESITALAAEHATTDESKQVVKKAVGELLDCFGAVDETLHSEKGKSYEEVSERVDAAMASLTALIKP